MINFIKYGYISFFLALLIMLMPRLLLAEDLKPFKGYTSEVYATDKNIILSKSESATFEFKYRKGSGVGWKTGATLFHITDNSNWHYHMMLRVYDDNTLQLTSSSIGHYWNWANVDLPQSAIDSFNDTSGNWHTMKVYISHSKSRDSRDSYVEIDGIKHTLDLSHYTVTSSISGAATKIWNTFKCVWKCPKAPENLINNYHYEKYLNGSPSINAKLYINGLGGSNYYKSLDSIRHFKGDIKDFVIKEGGSQKYHFLKSRTVKITSNLQDGSVFDNPAAGFEDEASVSKNLVLSNKRNYYLGDDKDKTKINPSLDLTTILGEGDQRFKLIKVEGKGSAKSISSNCTNDLMSYDSNRCTHNLTSFDLSEDSEIAYTWQEQYKVNIGTSGSGSSANVTVKVTPETGSSYTLAAGSRDYWLPKKAKIEITVPAKAGGKVVESATIGNTALSLASSTSSTKTYELTDNFSETSADDVHFKYDDQKYTLSTKVTRPINMDGSLAFSDSFAGLLNTVSSPTQVSATTQISAKEFKDRSRIDPSVKTTIYDPGNPYLRYQLVAVRATGSAKSLSFEPGKKIELKPFVLHEDSTIEYIWKKQHLIKLGVSNSKLKSSPIIKITHAESDSLKPGSVNYNKNNIKISFKYKLDSQCIKSTVFAVADPSSKVKNNYYLRCRSTDKGTDMYLINSDLKDTDWDFAFVAAGWENGFKNDGQYHDISIVFSSEGITVKQDGKVVANASSGKYSEYFNNYDFLNGVVVLGKDPSFMADQKSAFPGEISDFKIESIDTGEIYYPSNDLASSYDETQAGYWVDDGATVTLLMPISNAQHNLVTNGFLLTKSTSSVAESRGWEKVTLDDVDSYGIDYYQVTLSESMSIADAGKAEWQTGSKVYEFEAILGKPFSLDKALLPDGSPSELNKVRAQVPSEVINAIQGGHKPALMAAVEGAPNNSTILNSLIYSPLESIESTSLGRNEFDGTLYFTRPGKYRLEWLLGGDGFPIENGQGYPKLVAEVDVKWTEDNTPFSPDYVHIAETPDISLDPDDEDVILFKEVALTQRFKGNEADDSVVDDIKIKNNKEFSFPDWNDGENADISYRSVLVFTRRTFESLETVDGYDLSPATGNLDKEAVDIKIVESRHWSDTQVLTDKNIDIGTEIKEADAVHNTAVKHNGYVLQKGLEKARYNTLTYKPDTMEGEIFAVNQEVNSATAAKDGKDDLVVAWYKHYEADGGINWPSSAIRYAPQWPDEKATQRIVVASRLGSDGLSAKDATTNPGKRQFKFDPALYSDVKIYNQSDRDKAGYNPNEEHALVMPSFFYSSAKPQPQAAFALRNDLNQSDNTKDEYTSDPLVLVQYKHKDTGKYGMQVYHVEYDDVATSDSHDVYKVDTNGDGTKDTDGTFKYIFEYPTMVADPIVAPYPLESLIGAANVPEIYARNPTSGKNVYWEDKTGKGWAISGGGSLFGTFWYPLRADFWHPTAQAGDIVPFVKNSQQAAYKDKSKRESEYFVSDGNAVNYQYFNTQIHQSQTDRIAVEYKTYWKPNKDIPEMRIGETLTFEGGEEQKDSDGAKGLPSAIGWKSAELLYDSMNSTGKVDQWTDTTNSSARIQPAVRKIQIPLSTEYFPSDLEKSVNTEGWMLKGLNAGLKQRVYYDNMSGKLVLRGILNGRYAGDPLLTKAPGTFDYILQPNILTVDDVKHFVAVTEASQEKVTVDSKEVTKKSLLQKAMFQLYALSQNPTLTDAELEKVESLDKATAVGYRVGLSRLLRDTDNRLLVLDVENLTTQESYDKLLSLLPGAQLPKGIEPAKEAKDADGKVIPAEVFPKDLGNYLELIAVDPDDPWAKDNGSSQDRVPFGFTVEDSVTKTALRSGGKLVRIKEGKGYIPASQLGSGLAVFTNPDLIPNAGKAAFESRIVIAENNDPSTTGSPVSLHVIKINNRHYRGQIKTVFSDNVFDEKVTLRHTGDFGGNVKDLIFEWYYRENNKAETLPVVYADPSCPVKAEPSGITADTQVWKVFPDDRAIEGYESGQGRYELAFGEKTSKEILVDNDFYVRYTHKSNCMKDGKFDQASCSNWSGLAGSGNNKPCTTPAPVFSPQLVAGWVKRVTDNVNQYDARINDFSTDGAPATYVSMIEQAGTAYVGDVALNPDKNVIENVGLIALYQTVLNRAKLLSIDNASDPGFTSGTGQALQNAASRITQFYTLLGNEAYSDSLDPTIGYSTDSGKYGSLAPTIFTFMNQAADLAEEELALLRGRSGEKENDTGPKPVHNRLTWNFTNNDGEAAYALSYNISDRNNDGKVDDKDASVMYPQGHGDAWGHYLSGLQTYYDLLNHDRFEWVSRSEQYNIQGAVLDVDYLDERRFAEAAAAKAKVGSEVVALTYRQMYEEDPDGQWQGYKDTAVVTNPADSLDKPYRAWGVDGWVRRAHIGAYFDWAVANAILPEKDSENKGIQKIDRTTVPELQELSINGNEVLTQLAQINNGQNPLGLLPDVVPFDIEPTTGTSHFEQVFDRAQSALSNAKSVFDYASDLKHRIRQVADSQEEFDEQVLSQDRSYRDRLIEIYGTPYEGVIGAGKTYPEGYLGPDVYKYQYIDVGEVSDKTVPAPGKELTAYVNKIGTEKFEYSVSNILDTATGTEISFANLSKLGLDKLFPADVPDLELSTNVPSLDANDLPPDQIQYPFTKGKYSFTAPKYWGQRKTPGQIQNALLEIIKADVDFRLAYSAYSGVLGDLKSHVEDLEAKDKLDRRKVQVENAAFVASQAAKGVIKAFEMAKARAEAAKNKVKQVGEILISALPKVNGTSNDVTGPARAAAKSTDAAADAGAETVSIAAQIGTHLAESHQDYIDFSKELAISKFEGNEEERQALAAMQSILDNEPGLRLKLFRAREVVRQATEKFRALQGKGARLQEEREAFNKKVAAKTQGKRYQDMAFRLNQTEASQKYRAAYDIAAKYAYLAAKAYDYETNLSPTHPASAQHIMKTIVQSRTLGQVDGNEPVVGQGGLADVLGRLKGNYSVLKTQMGFNNPQLETEPFSLRYEAFRIKAAEDAKAAIAWRNELHGHYAGNLWDIPEFRAYMRPFADEMGDNEPALVIPFSTTIRSGFNFFGRSLSANDHAYDPSHFSTRIQSVGVWFEGYKQLGLAETARAYLVPVGQDIMYVPDSTELDTREWNVKDQKIPAPLPFGKTDMQDTSWLPAQALDGAEGQIRRHSQLRVYHDSGELDASQIHTDSRLFGRSVWNTRWLLVIPGAGLLADADEGVKRLIHGQLKPGKKSSCVGSECRDGNGISDIKLIFKTYAYSGN